MGTALFTCFGTVVAFVGAILLLIYVVIPVIGLVFGFMYRVIRFVFQELHDIILLPIALFVGIIKLCRVLVCIVLARWDIVQVELDAAKKRFSEVWLRVTSILIDNPLRVFAIDTKQTKKPTPRYVPAQSTQTKFEGYSIVGTLPSGGSGAKLYVAKVNNSLKQVVIKCFDISSGSQLPQIVRESRAMESAKKLGLVLEHHLDSKQFWYAMPYHAGDHLGVVTNLLHGKSNSLPESKLRDVLIYQHALLKTLNTYHNAGLWHKDVKPDNIIIHDGTAHLVDLGLVTPLGSAMTLTTHGTEYFRDPELVRQANRGVKVHQVDGSKFDVYGAGAVLYFMLENTFPAQGGLSSFNKQSPEGIRWIVRRAMADYDKRYTSIEEMLLDVETILQAKDITSVRPADLPSMGDQPVDSEVKRSPARQFKVTLPVSAKVYVYKTKPLGLLALIAAIVIGSVVAISYQEAPDQAQQNISEQLSVQDFPKPEGRVLIVSDLGLLHNPEIQRVASNTIAQLNVSGWDTFVNQDTEASVRSWLPTGETNKDIRQKLANENLAGVLVLKPSNSDSIEFVLIDGVSGTIFTAVQYVGD